MVHPYLFKTVLSKYGFLIKSFFPASFLNKPLNIAGEMRLVDSLFVESKISASFLIEFTKKHFNTFC